MERLDRTKTPHSLGKIEYGCFLVSQQPPAEAVDQLGLVCRDGVSRFDDLLIRGDDPAEEESTARKAPDLLLAGS